MVDHDAFNAMEALIEEVGESIARTTDEYYDEAHDAYEYLGPPGFHIEHIDSGTTPDIHTADEETLAAWNEDGVSCSYGIDASLTREKPFSNGIRVTLANAKAGVIGNGHHPIGDESHVVAGVYDYDDETNLQTHRFKDSPSVRADLRVFTDDDPYRVRRLVKSTTRSLAEGRHLNRIIEAVEDSGRLGPILVDGPIYPPMVFPELIARHHDGNDDAWTDVFGETVGNYIDAVTWALDTEWPLIGFVKDMDSSSFVTALEKKAGKYGPGNIEIPWDKDKHFLTDLLQPESPGTYVWTDWFEETKRYSNAGDAEEYVEAFEGSPYCEGDLDRYHRAFFFVYNPHTDTIMRVETPRGLVSDATIREYIQHRALAEIAKTGEAPEAILRADDEARISRQNQSELFAKLYSQMNSVTSYNEDYRGPDYLGEDT